MPSNPYEIPNHDTAGTAEAQRRQLAAVLRVGRVLFGQVLEDFGGGCHLVRVGRHRFSLSGDVELGVGQSFYFRVEPGRAPHQRVLRILADPGLTELRLQDALRRILSTERSLGDLLVELGGALVDEYARSGDPALEDLVVELEDHVLQPGADGLELADLLNHIGVGYEGTLLRTQGVEEPLVELLGLDKDLKARLLNAREEFGDGPAHDAIEAALAGVEAEQVLQVARQVEGDPNHWTFPLRDGDRWVPVSLFVQHREPEPGDAPHTPQWRVTLGADLSSVGPVRADFTVGGGGVTVRVLVTRPELVRALQESATALQDTLANLIDFDIDKSYLPARVTVLAAGPDEVDVSRRHLDIGYLRKRRVLDLRG